MNTLNPYQFYIIRDMGETIEKLLEESFEVAGFPTININSERPKKDNIKNMPAVNAYMYHVQFSPVYKERTQELVSTYNKEGQIIEYYQDSPVFCLANYIFSVWGTKTNEENLLMGLVIKTFLENTIITGDKLKGDAFYPDDKLNLYPNLQTDFNDVLAFWRSMNEEVRPSLFYHIKFRIESDKKSAPIRRVIGKKFAYDK